MDMKCARSRFIQPIFFFEIYVKLINTFLKMKNNKIDCKNFSFQNILKIELIGWYYASFSLKTKKQFL